MRLESIFQIALTVTIVVGVITGQILSAHLRKLRPQFMKNWDGKSDNPFGKGFGTASSILFRNPYAILGDKRANRLIEFQRIIIFVLLTLLVVVTSAHFMRL